MPKPSRRRRSRREAGGGRDVAIALAILALVVAVFGGSSRYDNWQLVLLQPFAWLAAGYFYIRASGRRGEGAWRQLAWPLALLGALAALMIAQLVPLPPDLWSALPGRDVVFALDRALGEVPARPISLTPTRTMNALAMLGVPIAAALAFAVATRRSLAPVVVALVAIAVAHAGLMLVQSLGVGGALLRPYYQQDPIGAAGLFANPNHAGIFASLMLVFLAAVIAELNAAAAQTRRGASIGLYLAYGFVFAASFAAASRAGLLTNAIALVATAFILTLPARRPMTPPPASAAPDRRAASAAPARGPRRSRGWLRRRGRPGAGGWSPGTLLLLGGGLVIALLFFASDRLPAFDEFVAEAPLEDLRFAYLPSILATIGAYFPVGAGFGAFEDAYYIFEPDALLRPAFLNMAHNDWLQLAAEGGIAGLAILAAALVWIGRLALGCWRAGGYAPLAALAGGTLVIALASYFDYPLRTPLFQLACVWLLLLVGRAAARTGMADGTADGSDGGSDGGEGAVNGVSLPAGGR